MKKITFLFTAFLMLSLIWLGNAQYINESFEGGFLPTGWTQINNGSGNDWTENTSAAYANTGTHSAKYAYDSDNAADVWMFTSTITLSVGETVDWSFYTRSRGFTERLKFTVGTAQTIASQTTTLVDIPDVDGSYGIQNGSYTAPFAGDYYFSFHCYSTADQFELFVDDVLIQTQPTCPDPTALVVSSETTTGADITWTDATGSNWDLYIAVSGGAAPTAGTIPTVDDTTNNTNTWTGGADNTEYDVWVRTDCGADNSSDLSAWVGAETFTTIANCLPPTILITTNITASGADLGWTENNSPAETEWDLYIVPTGDAAPTAGSTPTINDTTTNVHTWAGGTANTAYDFYVRTDCGADNTDVSDWSSSITFTTLCSVYTPDHTENFTTYVPDCWEEATGPIGGPTAFGSSGWVADGFGNVGSTGAARVEIYSTGGDEWLISPIFDLTGGGFEINLDVALTAWNGTGTDTIEADDAVYVMQSIDGGTTWTTIQTWDSTSTLSNTGDNVTIDVSGVTSATTQFAFFMLEGTTSGGDKDFFIDNFKVRTPPTCLEPTALAVNTITQTGASFSWIENNSPAATEWDLYIVTAGSSAPTLSTTPTIDNNTSQTPTWTAGLAETVYDVYVRTDCGADNTDVSAWSNAITFKTLCDATTYFTENFDSVSTPNISDCWFKIENSTTAFANITTSTASDISLPNSIRFYNGNDTSAELLLITPQLSDAINTGRIEFSGRDGDSNDLLIGTVTDPTDASTFTLHETVSLTSTHTVYTIDFDTYAGTDNFIAFKMSPGATYDYTYIDDFVWKALPTAVPSCSTNETATPDALCGNFETPLTWDAVVNADGYKISVGTTSGATDIENLTDLGTDLTYTLAGQTNNSTYFWTITPYNNVGDAVICTENSFTTAVNGCYCEPNPSSVDSNGITGIAFSTIDNQVAEENGVYYHDYSAMIGDVTAGATESIDITYETDYGYKTYIWIDWNDDFDFDDPDEEQLLGENPDTTNPETITFTFNVPATATAGNHRMRIGGADSGMNTTGNPCYTGTYGEFEDYTVNVVIPSCFNPGSLNVTGITNSIADLNWIDTNSGSETYLVEWRIVGSPTFTNYTTIAGANTYQLTSLVSQTEYEWQVTSSCGGSTVSGTNFSTLCDATTYFTENFDSVSTPNISDCWFKIENSTTAFANITTSTASDISLPNSIRFYNGNDASAELLLITPQLSDAINTGRIEFSGRDGDSNDLLIGTVTDPTDASTFTLHETVSLTSTHTVYTINFDTYAGTDNFIAFKMSPGATYDYTYIDDFVWEAIPSCLEPSSLTVDTETSLGANLGWSENNSPAETEWDLYIVATGSTAPNAVTVPTINDVTTSAYTWIGGTGNTTYDFYVRTDCGADNTDVSTWTGPVTFTTLCDSITTFPWTEDFESITAGQPDCWGIDGTTSTSTYHWYSYGTGETGRGMRFNSFLNTSGRTSELTTQTLDVTSLTVPQLKFHYKNPTAGNFEVLISSDGGSTFTSLESSLTGQTAWLEKTYDISVYSSANVIIKFFATSNYGNGDAYVYLDNVTIEEAPCPGGTTTWTGTSAAGSWDNGTPTVTMVAVIDGEYITSTNGDIDACSLNITSANGDLTVSANDYVKIENNINNDGLFLVESQGSVVQVDDLAVVTGDSSGFDVEVKTTVLADSDRFTYFSSPSVGNALDVFTWANQVYMWSFDGATQNWQYEAVPASTMMNPGQGYTVQDDVNTGADVETTNFSGVFNNGVITQPMYNAVVGAPDPMDNSSTLVGNPYPSAIESNKLFTENAQLGGIYIWNHDSALGAGYGDWANNDYIACAAGNACTSAPSAGTNAAHTGFIATGQGFFAISNTPSPSDLVFNNDMRVTDNNTQFRTQDEDRMWINLSDNTVGYYSQALFRFTSNGDDNLNNQYDALLLGSNYGLGFYSITSDTNDRLAIEDRGIFTDDITIPVGYTVNNPAVTELTFDIDHFQGLEGVNVYVKDNLLNILHDLKVANYTFNVTAVGEVNDRFEILFSRSALATNEVVIVNDDLVVSNQNDSQVQVNMLDGSIITNIKAFDTLGKLVIDIDSNSNSFVINTTLKQGQVVFVKATLENGQVLNKKFIKL